MHKIVSKNFDSLSIYFFITFTKTIQNSLKNHILLKT